MQLNLVDPVTLKALDSNVVNSAVNNYLSCRPGASTNKNAAELAHFKRSFVKIPCAKKQYFRNINSIPHPTPNDSDIIVDIGCGPYDCISQSEGQHFFVDDLMDFYVDELGAEFSGYRIFARTELLPFDSESVDIIYSVNMIDHVDDMPATVGEMYRILKPSGRIYLQTYFNSHPLLETEPGVFDRFFFDQFITPYFDVSDLSTFAIGDPRVSLSYTMDILGCVLKKKTGVCPPSKPRDRYLQPGYMGPQSIISECIRKLSSGSAEGVADLLLNLEGETCYQLHLIFLSAWRHIVLGDSLCDNISETLTH
jgi:SAM-dependent methyltransferase